LTLTKTNHFVSGREFQSESLRLKRGEYLVVPRTMVGPMQQLAGSSAKARRPDGASQPLSRSVTLVLHADKPCTLRIEPASQHEETLFAG
jgi:hypothetical protein